MSKRTRKREVGIILFQIEDALAVGILLELAPLIPDGILTYVRNDKEERVR